MAKKMIDGLFRSFEEAYESIAPLNLRLTSKSEDAAAEQVNRSSMDFVVCFLFIVEIGDTSGAIQLQLPVSTMTSLGGNNQRIDRGSLSDQLKRRLLDVPIGVTAKLGQQETTLRKALAIKPGDILPLLNPIDADVFIGKQPICKAMVLTDNNKLLLKVASASGPESENDAGEQNESKAKSSVEEHSGERESSSEDQDTYRRRGRRRNRQRSVSEHSE